MLSNWEKMFLIVGVCRFCCKLAKLKKVIHYTTEFIIKELLCQGFHCAIISTIPLKINESDSNLDNILKST